MGLGDERAHIWSLPSSSAVGHAQLSSGWDTVVRPTEPVFSQFLVRDNRPFWASIFLAILILGLVLGLA